MATENCKETNESFARPDMIVLTKDVMVPVLVPLSGEKMLSGRSEFKKRTIIVKRKKCRASVRERVSKLNKEQHNKCNDIYDFDCVPLSQRISTMSSRNSTTMERFYKLRQLRKRNKTSELTFPCTTPVSQASSFISQRNITSKTTLSVSVTNFKKVFDHRIEYISKNESLTAHTNEPKEKLNDYDTVSTDNRSNSVQSKINIYTCDSIHSLKKNNSTEVTEQPRGSSDTKSSHCVINKYSWQDLKNWLPPLQKILKLEKGEQTSDESNDEKKLNCKIKYSWQIIGISTQTSQVLVHSSCPEYDVNEYKKQDGVVANGKEQKQNQCSVKYSWQIIGEGIQASLTDNQNYMTDDAIDYWKGTIVTPRICHNKRQVDSIENFHEKNRKGLLEFGDSSKSRKTVVGEVKYILLYNEATQTQMEKETQADRPECHGTYSWQNLSRKHLQPKGYLLKNGSKGTRTFKDDLNKKKRQIFLFQRIFPATLEFSSMLSYPTHLDSVHNEQMLCTNDRSLKFHNKPDDYEVFIIEDKEDINLPFVELHNEVTSRWNLTFISMDQLKELSLDSYKDDEIHPDNELAENILEKKTTPLSPNIHETHETHEIPLHCGDIKARQRELTLRLSNTLAKLKQYEQHKDANWSLDYSLLDVKDDFSVKDAKLPRHVEENIKGIVDSAQEYIGKLDEQLQELDCADQQIEKSSEKTLKDIDETYQALMDDVCREINLRRHLLRMETEVYKNEGLAPLKACRQEVNAQIQSTQHLIRLIETMLSHPHTFNRDRLGKIVAASSNMGRIPAVPLLEELPYVTFSRPTKYTRDELLAKFSELGCVLRMGPAQFSDIEERPASLFVKWFIADPEYAAEEQTFIVQKALGEVLDPASNAFETVYEGSESSSFIRDLPVDQPVTLRVGIQATDTAWSVHRVAKTTIPAYSWIIDNKNYIITNSGKIAAKITDQISTLLSDGPQFNTDHIIEFKFLEASQDGKDNEGVALVFKPEGFKDTLKRPGALMITPNGKIFIDGEEKLMRLPKMRFGTQIAFTAERKDKDTLRINVECADKAVTYDWTVQTPLHFAARFKEYNKWNIMVK